MGQVYDYLCVRKRHFEIPAILLACHAILAEFNILAPSKSVSFEMWLRFNVVQRQLSESS